MCACVCTYLAQLHIECYFCSLFTVVQTTSRFSLPQRFLFRVSFSWLNWESASDFDCGSRDFFIWGATLKAWSLLGTRSNPCFPVAEKMEQNHRDTGGHTSLSKGVTKSSPWWVGEQFSIHKKAPNVSWQLPGTYNPLLFRCGVVETTIAHYGFVAVTGKWHVSSFCIRRAFFF